MLLFVKLDIQVFACRIKVRFIQIECDSNKQQF